VTIIGSTSQWKDFINLEPDIIDLVLSVWEIFKKPDINEIETRISRRFCESLRIEKNRRDLPFRIAPEHSLTDEEDFSEEGRIDICLLPSFSSQEDLYFAFECKRLRVKYDSGIKSLADEYTGKDGMMCFVSEQYGRGLPSGGMIAYVMDGKVAAAIASVKRSIDGRRAELRLKKGSGLDNSSLRPHFSTLKETLHSLKSHNLRLHHLFLAV